MSSLASKNLPEERIEGIRRAPRREAYENLPLSLIRDRNISYRALGVLTRLLSNADNFRMPSTALAQERKEGREAVRAALRELEAAGYIKREKMQNSRGQWSWLMVVSETPQVSTPSDVKSQSVDSRASASRAPENRTPVSRALKSSTTNDQYKEITTTTEALIWDSLPQLEENERVVVANKIEELIQEQRQDVLDELAGALSAKAIKGPMLGWLHGVVQKALHGKFKPNHAITVQSAREKRKEATPQKRREKIGLPPIDRIASSDLAEAHMAAIRKDLFRGGSA